MREQIIKLGQTKTVIFITITSIISSILLYLLVAYLWIGKDFFKGIIIATIIPTLITPSISWYMIKLLIKIHYLEIKMRELATFDSLTNVMSREAFLTESKNIYNISKKNSLSFAILYIDIDDFKKINDKYGHSTGDKVLKNFGSILNNFARNNDKVGRLGGEEFAFILPKTTLKDALNFANSLREIVNNQTIQDNNMIISYTTSIGISIFNNKNSVTLETLIKQSDKALYRAKHSGKNCSVIYKNLNKSINSIS